MKKSNPQLQLTIEQLRKRAHTEKSNFWLRIAEDLQKPSRARVIVNLSKISRVCDEGETVIVPGKVLAAGELDKNITVIAYQFSGNAKKKIADKGNAMDLNELAEKGIKGQKIRIMG